MTAAHDRRLRRAGYRAAHRGTKEMDWLLGRYAEARLAGMGEAELACFERALALPDPDLQAMILDGAAAPAEEIASLVAEVRRFHGLTDG